MDPVASSMGQCRSGTPRPQPRLLPWARGSGDGHGNLTRCSVSPQARCGSQRGQPQPSGTCGTGPTPDTSWPRLTTSARRDSWWTWPWGQKVMWPTPWSWPPSAPSSSASWRAGPERCARAPCPTSPCRLGPRCGAGVPCSPSPTGEPCPTAASRRWKRLPGPWAPPEWRQPVPRGWRATPGRGVPSPWKSSGRRSEPWSDSTPAAWAVTSSSGLGTRSSQRLALSCSCDFFRALFTCPMREATHDPAAPLATGLSSAELRLLLSFAYTGAVAGPWPAVLEAAETSLRYQAWGLLTLCLDVFTRGLTPETGLDVLAFAVAYGLAQVSRTAEDYILATFPSVVATPAFLDLPAHLLIRLLRSDGLNVLHELEALEAASRWLTANGDGQEDLAREVLSSVRFALMSGRELKKVPAVTAGVVDPKVLRELVVASLAPVAQLPCRVRSLQEVLVVCGGDKMTANLAARKPSQNLWFAHRYLSAVGLVKQVEWRALGHFPDGPRFRHAVAVVGNSLYVLGGKRYYGVRDTLASVYRYQPMDDSWERLASMTCGRSYFAAAALGDLIYALGGSSGELYCTDTVECYDLANDTWRRCQPLPMALCGHAVCPLDGALYVSGGCDEACRCLASLLRYTPAAPATLLAPMNGQRAGHVMEEAGGQLYVAGGLCQRDGQTGYRDQLAFEVYSPKLDVWVLLSPLPHAHVVGSAAVLGGELLVLGGYSHETYRDTHLIHAYQPGARRWITRGTLPHAYTDLQACVLTVPSALRGPDCLEDPARSPELPNNT
ncbi:kelch-like protein 33 isoform 1-T1 [Chlamydotis macqueenii]